MSSTLIVLKPDKYKTCMLRSSVFGQGSHNLAAGLDPIKYNTVDVRIPNVRFGKPYEKVSGYRYQSFGYLTFGSFTVNV